MATGSRQRGASRAVLKALLLGGLATAAVAFGAVESGPSDMESELGIRRKLLLSTGAKAFYAELSDANGALTVYENATRRVVWSTNATRAVVGTTKNFFFAVSGTGIAAVLINAHGRNRTNFITSNKHVGQLFTEAIGPDFPPYTLSLRDTGMLVLKNKNNATAWTSTVNMRPIVPCVNYSTIDVDYGDSKRRICNCPQGYTTVARFWQAEDAVCYPFPTPSVILSDASAFRWDDPFSASIGGINSSIYTNGYSKLKEWIFWNRIMVHNMTYRAPAAPATVNASRMCLTAHPLLRQVLASIEPCVEDTNNPNFNQFWLFLAVTDQRQVVQCMAGWHEKYQCLTVEESYSRTSPDGSNKRYQPTYTQVSVKDCFWDPASASDVPSAASSNSTYTQLFRMRGMTDAATVRPLSTDLGRHRRSLLRAGATSGASAAQQRTNAFAAPVDLLSASGITWGDDGEDRLPWERDDVDMGAVTGWRRKLMEQAMGKQQQQRAEE
ncbi:hypothetical protein HYH03_011459 [Edaphochlamys debaryana]|uniref:Bulb-type lectin domain-containing protein n=1 Tax=Edaphochlamys debaryana TaxID=47281 RepID=A0A835XUS9_9CHLO|nr:hypothetical protein HYH03_011459 [Edaphochlamys debaryana]|eukprot:KAG2490155.1 hypothetical protein HYH03_011459 [Edaphochlamys debaryana]